MLQIAIVDDLREERLRLESCLERYCSENKLSFTVSSFAGGEQFLALPAGSFDLVFLDIYMSGLTGMETAKLFRQKDDRALLVFVTTSSDFAVDSFRVRAFDYLLKPYSYEQFAEIMSLCEKALAKSVRYIEVKESRELIKIPIRDILYTDYDNHYIQIHTSERVVRTYASFAEFAPQLLDYPQFLNCYRNCIVNMDKVASLIENDFVLENGERVPITRDKRTELKQLFADYAFHKLNGDV